MKNVEIQQPNLKKLGAIRRKGTTLAQNELVDINPLFPDKNLPLVIQPLVQSLDLNAWAADNRDLIETRLHEHGGILFRNFSIGNVAEFERLIVTVCGETQEYRERSSPRSKVDGNIYTSTDYPAGYSIFLHNENSYQQAWPLKLFFFCITPASRGGETPIADCRNVFARIAPATRERFIQKQIQYVRNFGDGLGLPWQSVFQTEQRSQVEDYCRSHNILFEWKEQNRLRTRQVRPAVAHHPDTGDLLWFNHATFFHVSTLEPLVRTALTKEFAEEDLPTNSYYGDGSPIESCLLDELREAYQKETVTFQWQQGDVLMLDNMLVAHGRMPFEGTRKVVVGMAEPVGYNDLEKMKA